jgi:hypothetical protein
MDRHVPISGWLNHSTLPRLELAAEQSDRSKIYETVYQTRAQGVLADF